MKNDEDGISKQRYDIKTIKKLTSLLVTSIQEKDCIGVVASKPFFTIRLAMLSSWGQGVAAKSNAPVPCPICGLQ